MQKNIFTLPRQNSRAKLLGTPIQSGKSVLTFPKDVGPDFPPHMELPRLDSEPLKTPKVIANKNQSPILAT
ncbi:MAG: hypothetical protein JWQ35_1428 [Bacteriovoracaceae bacterium]|nr:hypothetical protein [Bacteriovoracaceae bacterium]